MRPIHLNILVPAYNEKDVIVKTITELVSTCEELTQDYQILIYNDGSTDGSDKIIDDLVSQYENVVCYHQKNNQNLGEAYRYALSYFDGDLFTWMPADGEIASRFVRDLYLAYRPNTVVYSSPRGSMSSRGKFRTTLSALYQFIFRTSFGVDLNYFNGPSLYPLKLIKDIEIVSKGFTVHGEVLIKAAQKGLKFKEVEYDLAPRAGGEAKALSPRSVWYVFKSYLHLIRCLKLQ